MLGFRADFGVSGYMDPEVAELLMQLILTEGSDAQQLKIQCCSADIH